MSGRGRETVVLGWRLGRKVVGRGSCCYFSIGRSISSNKYLCLVVRAPGNPLNKSLMTMDSLLTCSLSHELKKASDLSDGDQSYSRWLFSFFPIKANVLKVQHIFHIYVHGFHFNTKVQTLRTTIEPSEKIGSCYVPLVYPLNYSLCGPCRSGSTN